MLNLAEIEAQVVEFDRPGSGIEAQVGISLDLADIEA